MACSANTVKVPEKTIKMSIPLKDIDFDKPESRKQLKNQFLSFTVGENQDVIPDLLSGNIKSINGGLETIKEWFGTSFFGTKLNRLTSKNASDNVQEVFDILYPDGKVPENVNHIEDIIGLSVAIDSLSKESDLLDKYNIKDEDIKDHPFATAANRVEYVVGRLSLEAEGYIAYDTKKKKAMYYKARGKRIIQSLVDRGILSYSNHYAMVGDALGADRKPIGYRQGDKKNIPGMSKYPIDTISLGEKSGLDIDKQEDGVHDSRQPLDEKTSSVYKTLKQLRKMVTPSYIELPSTAPDGIRDGFFHKENGEIIATDSQLDTIANLQKGGFKLSPHIIKFLSSVKDKAMKSHDGDILRMLKQKGKMDPRMLQEVYGINMKDLESLLATEDLQQDLYQESIRGRELSKVTPILETIEGLETLSNAELFLAYFMARNGRLHMINTVGDYQADKFFSRHVYRLPKEVEYNAEESIEFAKRLQAEYGIPYDFILGNLPDLSDQDLVDVVLSKIREGSSDSKYGAVNALWKSIGGDQATTYWEKLEVIDAVFTIRDSNGEGFKTDIMLESDARASGIYLKLLQAAGMNPKAIKEVLTGLEDGSLKDAYAILQNAISPLLKKKSWDTSDDLDIRGLERLQPLLDTEIMSLRDITKMPIMTFAYEQGSVGNIIDFANEVTQAIIYDNNPKNVEALLGKENKNLTGQQLHDALVDHFIPLGTALNSLMEQEYKNKLYGQHTDRISKLFDILDSLKDPKVLQIRTPMSYLEQQKDSKATPRYMPLKKDSEIMNNKLNDVVYRMEISNVRNAIVNTIHAIDGAILLNALELTAKEIGLDTEGISIQMIHDAIRSDMKTVKIFEKHYEAEMKNISMNYDMVDNLIKSIEDVDSQLSDQQRKAVQKIKDQNDKDIETKKDIINTLTMKGAFATQLPTESNTMPADTDVQTEKDSFDTSSEAIDSIINGNDTYVIWDTETTGIGDNHRVIQIGAIKIKDGKKVGEFIYHMPQEEGVPDISADAVPIHNITNKSLAEAVDNEGNHTRAEIVNMFNKFVGKSPMIAQNASFDVAMLKKDNLVRKGGKGQYDSIAYFQENVDSPDNTYSIDSLSDILGVQARDHHNALEDSDILFELLEKVKKKSKKVNQYTWFLDRGSLESFIEDNKDCK